MQQPTQQQKTYIRLGEAAFAKVDKVNSELFTFTYGAFVAQLLNDFTDVGEVNIQIEKLGYNIGIRLIEEFLAKSGCPPCRTFEDTADAIAKVALKMFLGVSANVRWAADKSSYILQLDDNPLTDFVELPEKAKGLLYSNVLCGVIRGALEMVQIRVECRVAKCVLRDDDTNEIEVRFVEVMQERFFGDDD